ncbi:MAG: glycosyl transferase [Desulfuromonas sp.]|uniref:glycosyltransferase n=1 Tax=Desulfuromonas sp. TaxID=892 RepID=UPI000CAEB78B|nr:glycosyltransferase [Desulfuromonas sp.]PLX86043.1 MAG: glycosyl transferase [Desulfuromonas sp.]
MLPAVSVLLPVRNESRFLPAALASLQRQTLTDWELVAVDDGSTDATSAILAETARRDRRVRVLSRPPEGLVAALNAGLEACRAPLVARMDGDDVCHPQRLALQEKALRKNPALDLLACGVRHFPRPTLQEGMQYYERWLNGLLCHGEIARDLYVESPFAHPSVLFRRKAVLATGGYRDLGWPEDYDLWLRMARHGARFGRLPQTLLYWRDRPERLTRTAPHCSPQAFRDCKVHHLKKYYLRGEAEVTLWGAGIEGKAWRKALQAEGIKVDRWVEIDPRKIGQTIHGAAVVTPDALRPGSGKVLVTIGARGARQQVRERAEGLGLKEGKDFVCVT